MLPGSGITELFRSPRGIKPNPPRWKIQRRTLHCRRCYDRKNLSSAHFHSKPASILASRMRLVLNSLLCPLGQTAEYPPSRLYLLAGPVRRKDGYRYLAENVSATDGKETSHRDSPLHL